jgi:hypothetical protein
MNCSSRHFFLLCAGRRNFGIAVWVINLAAKHGSLFVRRNSDAALLTPDFEFDNGDFDLCSFHGSPGSDFNPDFSGIGKQWRHCNRLDAGIRFAGRSERVLPDATAVLLLRFGREQTEWPSGTSHI